MFPVGILLFFAGYAFEYTGTANLLNGGQGPSLSQALGVPVRVAPPSQRPNLSGQPPATAVGGAGAGGGGGGASF